MDNEKNVDFEDEGAREQESAPESAPRARNRTVMLTPEITGQVRARLAQDPSERATPQDNTHGGGFVPVAPRRGTGGGDHAHEGRRGAQPHVAAPAPQSRAAVASTAPQGDTVVWTKPAMLVGFLVSFDNDANGEFYVLRAGRLMVTSEVPSGGNYLFIDDETVSPMHAIVRIGEGGDIQVLDQLSECGSGVHRFETGEEVELSGDKCTLGHGDTIRFGKRSFQVCLMPKG